MRLSRDCRGVTASGRACRNRTRAPSGLCGRCLGETTVTWSTAHSPPVPVWRFVPAETPEGAVEAALAAIDDLRSHRKPPHYWSAVQAAGEALTSTAISPRLLRKAARQGPDRWHQALAENPNCPPSVLDRIADSPDPSARVSALGHPWCPRSTLAGVARRIARQIMRGDTLGDALDVAAAVARNPRTPPRALRRLARVRNAWVQARVAANPSTPGRALAPLAVDGDQRVREGVARNPAAPAEMLERLAVDGAAAVRAAVAANPSCPPVGRAAAGLLAD